MIKLAVSREKKEGPKKFRQKLPSPPATVRLQFHALSIVPVQTMKAAKKQTATKLVPIVSHPRGTSLTAAAELELAAEAVLVVEAVLEVDAVDDDEAALASITPPSTTVPAVLAFVRAAADL